MSNLFGLGVTEDLLEVVSRELAPGRTALVAEIPEEWLTPLDTSMAPFGGVVIREWRIETRVEEIRADQKRRRATLKQPWQLAKEALRP